MLDWKTADEMFIVARINALNRIARTAPARNNRAIEDFVRVDYPAVWRLCAALVDEASADDLAQETFSRAIPALAQFRGDARPRTWLLSIARHTCMDELRVRSRRRRRDDSLLVAAIRPTGERDRAIVATEASEECSVASLIECLDPERRGAFVLTQLLGFSYAETAQIFQCPIGTIRSRVARARSDLLELLAEVDSIDARRA